MPSTSACPAPVAPPQTTAGAVPTMQHGRLVVALGVLFALSNVTIDLYLPALPQVGTELTASDTEVQVTLTGMLVGLALGQLVVGPISDALGRRRPLVLGVAVHLVASVGCAVAPNIVVLAGCRVLQGLACAAVSVSGMALIRDLFVGGPAAKVIARLMIVIGVAPVVAPAVAIPETHPRSRRRSARPMATLRTYRMLLADRTFVALVLVVGLMLSALFSWIAGSPFVLQGRYGLSPQTFGLIVGANAVATVLVGQLNPRLLRRWQSSRLLGFGVYAAAGAAACLLVTATTGAGGLIGVLAPAAVVTAALGLVMPNAPALALSRRGEAAGTAAAVLGATQFGIGALTAPLVGSLGTATAAPTAAVICAATLGATALMVLVVRRDRLVAQ